MVDEPAARRRQLWKPQADLSPGEVRSPVSSTPPRVPRVLQVRASGCTRRTASRCRAVLEPSRGAASSVIVFNALASPQGCRPPTACRNAQLRPVLQTARRASQLDLRPERSCRLEGDRWPGRGSLQAFCAVGATIFSLSPVVKDVLGSDIERPGCHLAQRAQNGLSLDVRGNGDGATAHLSRRDAPPWDHRRSVPRCGAENAPNRASPRPADRCWQNQAAVPPRRARSSPSSSRTSAAPRRLGRSSIPNRCARSCRATSRRRRWCSGATAARSRSSSAMRSWRSSASPVATRTTHSARSEPPPSCERRSRS